MMTRSSSRRPRIICHMAASVAGRIVVKTLMLEGVGTPALFDRDGYGAAGGRLALKHVERRADDVLSSTSQPFAGSADLMNASARTRFAV